VVLDRLLDLGQGILLGQLRAEDLLDVDVDHLLGVGGGVLVRLGGAGGGAGQQEGQPEGGRASFAGDAHGGSPFAERGDGNVGEVSGVCLYHSPLTTHHSLIFADRLVDQLGADLALDGHGLVRGGRLDGLEDVQQGGEFLLVHGGQGQEGQPGV